MNILETKDLKHDFNGMKVLFGVDLQVKEGERHAVIGPNGAGKTTLFNIITGMYRPSQGNIFLKGNDVTGFKPHRLARLGVGRAFQITSTFPWMTAFQNIRLAILSKRGIRFNVLKRVNQMRQLTRETEEMLEKIQLITERDVLASKLSYGKNRALEIGMALAINPEVVFLDEFAAGMSQEETTMILELIRELTEGKTVVIIEHDMDVVFSLADRITVLHNGKILATGTPDEIYNNTLVRDAYLGDIGSEASHGSDESEPLGT